VNSGNAFQIRIRLLIGALLRLLLAALAASALDRGKNLIAFCTFMIAADFLWLLWLGTLAILQARFLRGRPDILLTGWGSRIRLANVFLILPIAAQVLAEFFEDRLILALSRVGG
jgi:hypothetical protein